MQCRDKCHCRGFASCLLILLVLRETPRAMFQRVIATALHIVWKHQRLLSSCTTFVSTRIFTVMDHEAEHSSGQPLAEVISSLTASCF